MTTQREKNIFYLEELSDYKVADSDKDVRGWHVRDKEGRVIGKVDNLLVNKNSERVVYLDVEVDNTVIDTGYKPYQMKAKDGVHDFVNADGENHVIVPIGMAHLDLDNEVVATNEINFETFAETKRIKKGAPIYREYETVVFDSYNRSNDVVEYPKDDSFYERGEFNS